MIVPDHPRDITIGVYPIGKTPHPFVEFAETAHHAARSAFLQVDLPAGETRHALRFMISTIGRGGKRHVEVARLHYRQDRQRLVRYLASLEPDAAREGIADANRLGPQQ